MVPWFQKLDWIQILIEKESNEIPIDKKKNPKLINVGPTSIPESRVGWFSEQTHVYRSIVPSSVVLDRVEGGAKIFEFQMNQKPTRNSSPQKQGKHYQPLFSTAKQFFCSKL